MPYLLVPSPFGQGGYGDGGYGFFAFWFDIVQPTITDVATQRANVPQEFSTASVLIPTGYGAGGYGGGPYGYVLFDPSLLGPVDGVNKSFMVSAFPRRMRVFWNGILQTQNYDVAVGGNSILFLKSTPNQGDIVTAEVWI